MAGPLPDWAQDRCPLCGCARDQDGMTNGPIFQPPPRFPLCLVFRPFGKRRCAGHRLEQPIGLLWSCGQAQKPGAMRQKAKDPLGTLSRGSLWTFSQHPSGYEKTPRRFSGPILLPIEVYTHSPAESRWLILLCPSYAPLCQCEP